MASWAVGVGVGCALMLWGVAMIVFSARLVRAIAQEQRSQFGRLGRWVASRGKPSALITPGIFCIVIGAIAVVATIAH